MRGLEERGVIVRAGTALGQAGWLRVTYGTRRRERPLPGRARRGAVARPALAAGRARCYKQLRMSSHATPASIVTAPSGGRRRAYAYWRFS